MTDPRPSAPLFFSQLMLDYLNSADSLAAGVPTAAELPRVVLDAGTIQTVPGLVITAQEQSGGASAKKVMHVMFAVLYQLRASGADAAADAASLAHSTTFIAASRMHDLVASRLANVAAFRAFLNTTTTRDSGVQIMHYRRLKDPDMQREDKPTPRHELMCAVEVQALFLPQRLL